MRRLLTRWPPRFLRTSESARFLALSVRTLEKHRCYGTGPKYRKLGGRVIYGLADLKAWADLGIKASTSDPGSGLYCRLSQFSRLSSADELQWSAKRPIVIAPAPCN